MPVQAQGARIPATVGAVIPNRHGRSLGRSPYNEGDWFAVPLRNEGHFAVGVVARMDGEGVVLGYFFGPARSELPALHEIERFPARDAVAVHLFGDLALIEGEWPIIGRSPHWNRAEWPMPAFSFYEELTNRALALEYSDNSLTEVVSERPITREEAARLPEDGLLGAGAVEIVLTRLLIGERPNTR